MAQLTPVPVNDDLKASRKDRAGCGKAILLVAGRQKAFRFQDSTTKTTK
jgi:hypothetical protein